MLAVRTCVRLLAMATLLAGSGACGSSNGGVAPADASVASPHDAGDAGAATQCPLSCDAPFWVCDPTKGTCVQCLVDADCTRQDANGRGWCTSHFACKCSPQHTCKECNVDADCAGNAAGPYCLLLSGSSSENFCGCKSDGECGPATPTCLNANQVAPAPGDDAVCKCRQCNTDSLCTDPKHPRCATDGGTDGGLGCCVAP